MSVGGQASVVSPATVLITGASGGLGRALALHYAQPGRTLVLHGRVAWRLRELADACAARGANVIPFAADLLALDDFRARLADLVRATPVDLAIVNAGVSSANRGEGETWADIEQVLDVNLRAAIATAEVLLPPMRARGSGQVAYVSSLAAWHGLALTPAYCASKAALKAYAEAQRAWLAPLGVAINIVLPGYVRTPMSAGLPGAKPFMLEPEDAARRIARGLARNRARIAFPQPLAAGAWLLAALPASWSQLIVRRLGL